MKRIAMALLLQMALTTATYAQVMISNAVAKDVGQTYGFYLGQKKTLKNLSQDHPDLARAATVAEMGFESTFGAALRNMDERMAHQAPNAWPEIKDQLDSHPKLASYATATLARRDAIEFLQEVDARTHGNIPSPIIETLLMFHPVYEKSPAQELVDGYKQRYQSNGAGKAKGVSFSLEFPRSWAIKEGKRPNIVMMGVSENGRGLEMLNVGIREFILDDLGPVTHEEIIDELQATELRDAIPAGSIFIKSGPLTLESLPGYWVRFDTANRRGRDESKMSVLTYTVFYNDRRIDVTAMVGAAADDSHGISERFKRFEPLFDQIVNTLVIPGVWEQNGR